MRTLRRTGGVTIRHQKTRFYPHCVFIDTIVTPLQLAYRKTVPVDRPKVSQDPLELTLETQPERTYGRSAAAGRPLPRHENFDFAATSPLVTGRAKRKQVPRRRRESSIGTANQPTGLAGLPSVPVEHHSILVEDAAFELPVRDQARVIHIVDVIARDDIAPAVGSLARAASRVVTTIGH